MRVTLWGTRGSVAAPGPETVRYGGNTASVSVLGVADTLLALDAGTGIRRLGATIPRDRRRIDLLLTHLHMDHLQGLGFFAPLHSPAIELHIWGPASITLSLHRRLTRYLSPPLFPVHLRDVPCQLHLHEVPDHPFEIGEFEIQAKRVMHPGPTVGYRITSPDAVLTYLPDHEPALGAKQFPQSPRWTSGFDLAHGADLLIHDAQYSVDEYQARIGWGHSSLPDAFAFAKLTQVKSLVPFHHDPSHSDDDLDKLISTTVQVLRPPFRVLSGAEGASFLLGDRQVA